MTDASHIQARFDRKAQSEVLLPSYSIRMQDDARFFTFQDFSHLALIGCSLPAPAVETSSHYRKDTIVHVRSLLQLTAELTV